MNHLESLKKALTFTQPSLFQTILEFHENYIVEVVEMYITLPV